MPNLGRIIASHKTKVVPKRPWGNCSCPKATREAGECPLGGECLEECIVYQATVKVKVDEATGVEKVPDQTYLDLKSCLMSIHTLFAN